MTLELFWAKEHQTMRGRKRDKSRQPADNAATPLAHHGGEQDEEEDDEAELDPGLAKALDLMTNKLMVAINEKLEPLAQTVLSHTTELKKTKDRLDEAEARVLQLETANESQGNRITALEKKVEDLIDHVDDLENRGRRKNIRIFNLPEDVEGKNALDFFEHWLPDFLDMDAKGGRVKLERAHRSLMPKPAPEQRPRPVIIRFHAFPEKQRVMAAARRKAADGDITLEGKKISFYNDLSAEVLRKRKEFKEAKQHLRQIGADYSMLFPAKLQVSLNGKKKTFLSPAEALIFAKQRRSSEMTDTPTTES